MRVFTLILIFIGSFIFDVGFVFAQDGLTNEQIRLSRNPRIVRLCNNSYGVEHVPDADVEYKPGIDAKGNFIVPPDVGFSSGGMTYPINIPLELDIIERFNLDVPIGIMSDPTIAGIRVFEDGNVTYNGQEITDQVRNFCQENRLVDDIDVEVIGSKSNENVPTTINSETKNETTSEIEIEELPPLDGSAQ